MRKTKELKIDPEFRDKIPPLTDAEYEQLEENIISDGEVYEPICVWKGIIVDGHNRYKIVQKHPEIPFRTKNMDFADKWEAFEWMYKKQLGRRNLTEEQKSYMVGKMYEARKKSVGQHEGNQYTKMESGQNVQIPNKQNVHNQTRRETRDGTAGQIGKEIGVDGRTVRRAEKFAKGVDALKEVSPEAADAILKGGSGVTKGEVSELPQKTEEEKKEFAAAILGGSVEVKKEREEKKRRGFNKEAREQKKLVDEVIADMYSTEMKPFTIEMLEGDIEINGQNYIDMLRNTLIERSTLLVGENRPKVAAKIDYIITEIQKIRRLVE